MTPHYQAQQAYSTSVITVRSSRLLEYDVMAKVTSELTLAASNPHDFKGVVQSVDRNRRVWALIAASASDDQNTLPATLKAQLFYLFEFTSQHSRKILKGNETLQPLIDINLSIMRGLKPEEPT